jgi:hypothetical protein
MIDIYGGAVNSGWGPLTGTPYYQFPAPFGGQGLDAPMDIVEPLSWVYIFANVTYNYWPVQDGNVTFEIQEPNGTFYKKLNAFTDTNGVAGVNYQMPWSGGLFPSENLFGVWHITATVQLANVTVNDTMNYHYDYLLHVSGASVSKSAYLIDEPVCIIYNYSSYAQQTKTALFHISIVDNLGVTVGTYVSRLLYGAATFPETDTRANIAIIRTPNWTYPGVATVHINVFDGEIRGGGVALAPEHLGPTFYVQPTPLGFSIPDHYSTIQDAINNVASGDAILVREGTYQENIVVNKTVTLLGQDLCSTFIDGGGEGDVISAEASDVLISGFTIAGSGVDDSGVTLNDCNNTVLQGNNIENDSIGISFNHCSQSFVINNNLMNNTSNILVVNSTMPLDAGYPSGGNYWSDYTGTDLYSGPCQKLGGSDGIGDSPYVVDSNNIDDYPLISPYPSHGIGIQTLVIPEDFISKGAIVLFNVTVMNKGDAAETFNITLSVNGAIIHTETVFDLPIRSSTVSCSVWSTMDSPFVLHQIEVDCSMVQGEIGTADNTVTSYVAVAEGPFYTQFGIKYWIGCFRKGCHAQHILDMG